MLPNMAKDGTMEDRVAILTTSLTDGQSKLLSVPSLPSGTGKDTADSVQQNLIDWKSDKSVIGMCFDTTSANTGRLSGACVLLESLLGRDLLWLSCRHHVFEVVLSDTFTICFGPSTGPEILLFKRFRDSWPKLCHEPAAQPTPLVSASQDLKDFIVDQLTEHQPRDDYKELLHLSARLVGIPTTTAIRRPGAIHRARWMAKAIYSLKMELLYDGNEQCLQLRARELLGIQRFNRFVVCVYIQSWFTSTSAVDAPINDIKLLQRLNAFDDDVIRVSGLKAMLRHSWYLGPELATLTLFSDLVTESEKQTLVDEMVTERGPHLLTRLPQSVTDLKLSKSFFFTTGINAQFLDRPTSDWSTLPSYKEACALVRQIACVNDSAERGVKLIQEFNASATDERQKQLLLQVVEEHRLKYNINRDSLFHI